MVNKKISVIMSVYNSEKFLSEAIESILNQTFSDFEFLIINDSSTDNSSKIIEQYKKNDKRIVLINNEKNLGLTKSLNIGLKKAQGEYIARMDSDDISLPERFATQYTFLEKNREVFLLGSGAYDIDEQGEIRCVINPPVGENKVKETLALKNCIYHPTIFFRNEKIFYREKFHYSQDYDFYLSLLTKGKNLDNIDAPLIKYRISKDAVSWSKSSKQKLFEIKAMEFFNQRLEFGKDEYDSFDPEKILNFDVENSKDKVVLESEFNSSFQLNDFKRARRFCIKYFKNHGIFNKLLFYYLLSFTGKSFVDFVRKN